MLPHNLPFNQIKQLNNIYDPIKLGTDGRIRSVFPQAGDMAKMYILDSERDPVT